MHTKEYLREIILSMMFLQEQIDKIESYPDRSLLFQNPKIIEGWANLVGAAEKIICGYDPEYIKEWLKRTETYVGYLISLRQINLLYDRLQRDYLDQMKKIIDYYDGWEKKEFINADVIKTLQDGHYLGVLEKDIKENFEELNSKLLNARSDLNSVLLYIYNYLLALMDRISQIFINLVPSAEDFAKAIDEDLREWTIHFGKSMFKRMKEDLHRHFNQRLTENNKYELWNEILRVDEKALLMASKQQLATCEDEMQEHWGEDRKALMDENGKLMHLIYSSCYTEELFDFGKAENVQPFIALLTPDNLSMFYDIIVRRNLIQCEMYSELKAQHDRWLNPTKVDNMVNHDMPQMPLESEEGLDNEEPAEEECFRFVHVEIEDEEAWRIHRAIKRLVANYRIPEICEYLKEQKQNGKLMLPSNPSNMYNELVRLGMPNGDGFSEKNFSNIYNSYMK